MIKKPINNKGEIIIYQDKPGEKAVDVRLENDTIWLNSHQTAEIFNIDRTGIVRHISNVYKTGELDKNSTCAKITQVARDGKMREIDYYNLDMIISVGYRINSKKATRFRIWATNILKKYLTEGYVVNKKTIAENYDKFLKTVEDIKSLLPAGKNLDNKDILELIKTFADTWLSLDAYDKDKLETKKITKRGIRLTAAELSAAISDFKNALTGKKEATEIFARERSSGSLEGIIGNVMQKFGGHDLYPGLEEKSGSSSLFHS
ncbi:MAG: RhuM family protein [Candidatus Falkowbacteria bacterium]